MPEDLPGDDELKLPPAFFPTEAAGPGSQDMGEPIQVTIEGIFGVPDGGETKHLVQLSDGERRLPIMIGPLEAYSISQGVERVQSDRPSTLDLFKVVVERIGGDVTKVVIDDLWNSVYYAKLFIKTKDGVCEIDSRPSDAIALAVRFDAPIFVREGILDNFDQQVD